MSVDEDKLAELLGAATKACGDNDEAVRAVRALAEAYDSEIGDLEEEVEEAQDNHTRETTEGAINRFCDVVQRPVGTRDFTVPKTSEAGRAILGLYDAINRNL